MEAIITVATVAAMYMNLAGSPVENGYNYNARINGGKVEQISVYAKNEGMLSNKLQYDYVYDEAGRLAVQVAKTWNSSRNRWENYYELNYNYDETGYSLVRCDYNKRTGKFDKHVGKYTYEMLDGNVMAVNSYRWDKNCNDYAMVDNILVMNPTPDVLYAQADFENMLMGGK